MNFFLIYFLQNRIMHLLRIYYYVPVNSSEPTFDNFIEINITG